MTVAIKPTDVAVPAFFVHQTDIMRQVKPSRSQAKGRWVIVKKTGEIVTLRTPHRAAHIAIATISLLLKYTNTLYSSTSKFYNTFFIISITLIIKVLLFCSTLLV